MTQSPWKANIICGRRILNCENTKTLTGGRATPHLHPPGVPPPLLSGPSYFTVLHSAPLGPPHQPRFQPDVDRPPPQTLRSPQPAGVSEGEPFPQVKLLPPPPPVLLPWRLSTQWPLNMYSGATNRRTAGAKLIIFLVLDSKYADQWTFGSYFKPTGSIFFKFCMMIIFFPWSF